MGRRGCASAMGMIKFPSSCSSPKALCNQFIDYYICSRGVFCINHIKLRNFVVITIECSIATVDRGSIMTRIYRWSMMVYSSLQAEFMKDIQLPNGIFIGVNNQDIFKHIVRWTAPNGKRLDVDWLWVKMIAAVSHQPSCSHQLIIVLGPMILQIMCAKQLSLNRLYSIWSCGKSGTRLLCIVHGGFGSTRLTCIMLVYH